MLKLVEMVGFHQRNGRVSPTHVKIITTPKTTNFLTVKFTKALCLTNDSVCRYIIIRRLNSVTCRIAGNLLTGDDYLSNVAIIYG